MRTIFDEWMEDIPGQFHGKKNIEILIKAFSRQLQEVQRMFAELYTKTDIDAATGQNLDYVGTIVSLSSRQAGELAGMNVSEPVISDERYRMYLRYKMLKNTSECTYYDIMAAIEILWDISRASYYERTDRPATIFIGLPMVGVESDDQAEGKPAIMRPAGVGFIYTAQYGMAVDQSDLEVVRLMSMDMHTFLYFFKRILNGAWCLDGSVSLGQIPICEIAMETIIGPIGVVAHTGGVHLPALELSAAVPMVIPIIQCDMDVGCDFDSSGVFDSGAMTGGNVGVNIPVCVDIKVNAESVTIEKDLWHLDGQILLDGSRILDAETWKESL